MATKVFALFVLLVVLFITNIEASKFVARAIPTVTTELATHFDGLYQCKNGCSGKDKLEIKLMDSASTIQNILHPTKVEIEWFSEQDVSLGKFSSGFSDQAISIHDVSIKNGVPAGSIIRFAGVIHYKSIQKTATSLVKPSIYLVYTESLLNASTASVAMTFVDHFESDFVIDLVYDHITAKSFVLFAVAKDIKFETNHMIIRPFGALRSKPDYPEGDLRCTVNSLPFKVNVLKDEMGDNYFDLVLQDSYRSAYHFPFHTDISFQCHLGQQLLNDKAPFGLAFSFFTRNSTVANLVPTHFATQKDIAIIHWHQDFLDDYKILLPFEQYQSSFVPYHVGNDGKPIHPVKVLSNSVAPVSTTAPTFSPLTVGAGDNQRTVWRSHATYFYLVYGSHITFDPKKEHFELKVQNTHHAKPVATQWALSVEQSNQADGQVVKGHHLLDRGELKPIKNEHSSITYNTFKPSVSKETADQHQFLYTLLSIDVELEYETYPSHLKYFFPASISLTLHKQVKKYPDQPLSDWAVTVIGSYPYSSSIVDSGNDLRVVPTVYKEKTDKEHRAYKLDIYLTPNKDFSQEFSITLPSQQYVFTGDFSTCLINGKKTVGRSEWGEEFKKGSDFLVHFTLPEDMILTKGTLTSLQCPDGYIISSFSLKGQDFPNDFIPFVFLGEELKHSDTLEALYAHANIEFTDHLHHNRHGFRNFIIVAFILAIIAGLCYLIFIKRDAIFAFFHSSPSSSTHQPQTDYDENLNSLNSNGGGYEAPNL